MPFVYLSFRDLVPSQISLTQFFSALKRRCNHTHQNLLGGFISVLELPCTGVHKIVVPFSAILWPVVKYVDSLKLTTVAPRHLGSQLWTHDMSKCYQLGLFFPGDLLVEHVPAHFLVD